MPISNSEYQKEYYKNHKNELLTRLKQKFICDVCGGSYSYVSKNRHNESAKHQKKLNSNIQIDEESKNMIEALKQKGLHFIIT